MNIAQAEGGGLWNSATGTLIINDNASDVQIQNNVIKSVLCQPDELKPPFLLRLMRWFPVLARIPARVIGLGFRPEHADARLLQAR